MAVTWPLRACEKVSEIASIRSRSASIARIMSVPKQWLVSSTRPRRAATPRWMTVSPVAGMGSMREYTLSCGVVDGMWSERRDGM